MKHLKLTFLLTVFMSMVSIGAMAHDFEVVNADGKTIYYVKTSDSEVAVSYKGESYSSFSNEYSGNVVIPKSVTYDGTTYNVTSIREFAFAGCNDLTLVTIGDGVITIGKSAFGNCRYLKTITIPNSVTSIGEQAFSGCGSLTSITIPNSVTSISRASFSGCSSLTSVTIPNSVTSIGNLAFNNCSSLTSITIPKSVTSIDIRNYTSHNVFSGCSSLTSIKVEEGNTKYDSRNNCNAIIETATKTLITGCMNTVIPNSVRYIGYYAFSNCRYLKSITIPYGVTSIYQSAFYGCDGLESITISNSVNYIDLSAFDGCNSLQSITIPNSVTSIGSFAFGGCSNLTSVTVEWAEPISISSNTFSNCSNATLYVPYGCKAAYKDANYWKEFKKIAEYVETADITDISTLNNVIYLDEVQGVSGNQKTISIKMKNTAAIRGFQFNMTLPEGVTPATYSNGTIMCSLSDARRPEGDQHTISVSQQADGSYLFLCGSLANETFTGTDGEVLTLKINIADNVAAGDYPIALSSIKLTETNIDNYYEIAEVVSKLTISDYELGDISGDGVVDVSDYIGVANHILGKTPAGFNAMAADVNGDGVIDISDYIGIANIILTGSIYGK